MTKLQTNLLIVLACFVYIVFGYFFVAVKKSIDILSNPESSEDNQIWEIDEEDALYLIFWPIFLFLDLAYLIGVFPIKHITNFILDKRSEKMHKQALEAHEKLLREKAKREAEKQKELTKQREEQNKELDKVIEDLNNASERPRRVVGKGK